MKAVIVLVVLVGFVASAEIIPSTPELDEAFHSCIKETGVSKEIAERVKLHDLDFDDAAGKCFSKCVCLKTTWCTKEYLLDTTDVEQHTKIDHGKLHKARDLCNELKGADECDTVHKRFACYFKEVPETPIIDKV